MADDVKVKITEKNGVELEFDEEYTLDAQNIPFDETVTGELIATDIQGAIDELSSTVASSASPGFSFGRASNVNSGTWLNCEGVPSNKSGRWVYIDSAVVTRVFVSNEQISTFTISIYYHDGNEVNLTLLGSVNVVSSYGNSFTVSFPVPTDKQLALRVTAGSARNVVAGLELQGTN
jgi:hypothetical protein